MKNYFVDILHQFIEDTFEKKFGLPKQNENEKPVPITYVKVAEATNFDDVITYNGKDTFIKFYAPWCRYCKQLAPIYDELGRQLQNEDVEIVKMDATANDIPPNFDVRAYPTLYWLPKHSKRAPILYKGGRSVTDFIQFIAKHATNELNGYDRNGKPKSRNF